ncbi:hypothetical protein JR316_0009363 [Psilocybe cubensis]|uniref:Uncharacterized protein n=1 Tax=Psilocybe cubensis TaxID=181762 RepID=A0ACB8GUJ9_PSICU|nr:hypothetical protein JR316_0009363 [Psilocybe cubensis]KAH9478901.1 hypothetical protein JR316_0009363 [Psilocybe cubensis]
MELLLPNTSINGFPAHGPPKRASAKKPSSPSQALQSAPGSSPTGVSPPNPKYLSEIREILGLQSAKPDGHFAKTFLFSAPYLPAKPAAHADSSPQIRSAPVKGLKSAKSRYAPRGASRGLSVLDSE